MPGGSMCGGGMPGGAGPPNIIPGGGGPPGKPLQVRRQHRQNNRQAGNIATAQVTKEPETAVGGATEDQALAVKPLVNSMIADHPHSRQPETAGVHSPQHHSA